MKRRAFLASPAAVAIAPFAPPAAPADLALRPDAFALAMAPLRFDVLIGYARIDPDFAFRVEQA